MVEQGLKIASWGEHVYVKIPVTDTAGEPPERVSHAEARADTETQRAVAAAIRTAYSLRT